jgi:hypothetical protein
MIVRRLIALCLCSLSAFSCVGTTGGDLLELHAYAAGPSDASADFRFQNSLGYQVELTQARLFVGGMYLNRSRPTSVSSDTSCSLSGIYVAEVLGGREVDLLSPTPQAFPNHGFATTDVAATGEVWLSQGDVNQAASGAVILRVSGTAARDGQSFPFEAALTIGQNRVVPVTDPALPGQHPICKQRIVSPIPLELRPAPQRALLLRVDPRNMFGNVDFATLTESGGVFRFADQAGVDQASDNLYAGLRRSSGVYSFAWLEEK